MVEKFMLLSNGVKIPSIGFGTYKSGDDEETAKIIKNALNLGYKMIDTASFYNNEVGIGNGIKESDIDRKDIFIVTKLWNDDHGYDNTIEAFNKSLNNLQVDYIDLYLIHWPNKLNAETWRAFEDLYKAGKVKAIGVCNFKIGHLEELKKNGYYERCYTELEKRNVKKEDIIKTTTNPIQKQGDLAILKGNLAPEGAVIKHSAVPKEMQDAVLKARPFDSEEEAIKAVLTGVIQPGEAIIIRYEGPKGSGMPEMFYTTEAIASDSRISASTALITDGRFSSATRGPAIGHVSPEASEGGPIALIANEDLIRINVAERKLEIIGVKGEEKTPEEIDEILKERKSRWIKPAPKYTKGPLGIYTRFAVSPMKGGYIEIK